MNKRMICALILSAIALSSCAEEVGYKDYSFDNIAPAMVDEVPNGYIEKDELSRLYEVTVGFFESQIYFLDANEENILQTSLSDKNLLIQYKDDIYINRLEFGRRMELKAES